MTRVEMSFVPVSAVPLAVFEAEAALLSSNATDKRRREFAAGRYAARAAVRRLTGYEDVVILRDAAGAPVIARGLGPVHVSISHADRTAVAVAARTRVGVDIVSVEDHGRPFVREAFATGELRSWARLLGCDQRSPLVACVAFAAKEAALKWLRVGLKAPLHSVVLNHGKRRATCTWLGSATRARSTQAASVVGSCCAISR